MGFIDKLRAQTHARPAARAHAAGSPGIPATSPASEDPPAWMTHGLRITIFEGRDDLDVVGESFYQNNLWELVGGRTRGRVRKDSVAVLVAEHDNRYDANAVSVWIEGCKVGHLGRADAEQLRPGLLALQRRHNRAVALAGAIVGGGADEGRAGTLGVFLRYDPIDFGLSSERPSPEATAGPNGNVRTGLSNAVSTDTADDGYDLSWLHTLPTDPSKRIVALRRLLEDETAPISRHYVFTELESTLYKFRDTFPGVLTEYDAVCRSHDSEMDVIQPALLDKFGVVPLLDTYRQAAIRHQKAEDLSQALWWAERGIALYGDRPANQEMVDDLRKRASSYRRKLR